MDFLVKTFSETNTVNTYTSTLVLHILLFSFHGNSEVHLRATEVNTGRLVGSHVNQY